METQLEGTIEETTEAIRARLVSMRPVNPPFAIEDPA